MNFHEALGDLFLEELKNVEFVDIISKTINLESDNDRVYSILKKVNEVSSILEESTDLVEFINKIKDSMYKSYSKKEGDSEYKSESEFSSEDKSSSKSEFSSEDKSYDEHETSSEDKSEDEYGTSSDDRISYESDSEKTEDDNCYLEIFGQDTDYYKYTNSFSLCKLKDCNKYKELNNKDLIISFNKPLKKLSIVSSYKDKKDEKDVLFTGYKVNSLCIDLSNPCKYFGVVVDPNNNSSEVIVVAKFYSNSKLVGEICKKVCGKNEAAFLGAKTCKYQGFDKVELFIKDNHNMGFSLTDLRYLTIDSHKDQCNIIDYKEVNKPCKFEFDLESIETPSGEEYNKYEISDDKEDKNKGEYRKMKECQDFKVVCINDTKIVNSGRLLEVDVDVKACEGRKVAVAVLVYDPCTKEISRFKVQEAYMPHDDCKDNDKYDENDKDSYKDKDCVKKTFRFIFAFDSNLCKDVDLEVKAFAEYANFKFDATCNQC